MEREWWKEEEEGIEKLFDTDLKRKFSASKIRDPNNNNNDDDDDDDLLLVGLKRGESSFEIDTLKKKRKKGKIPREDGKEWPKDFTGEGGYYEEDWRSEAELRKKILESDPNFQFLTLVAGSSNTAVEQLYEEGDIQAILQREQFLSRQQKQALEEVKASAKDVERDVDNITRELEKLKKKRVDIKSAISQGDQFYSNLGKIDSDYVQQKETIEHLRRKLIIMQKYTGESGFRDDDTFKSVKETLLLEATYTTETYGNQINITEVEKVEQLSDEINTLEIGHFNMTELLLKIWFSIDEPSDYQTYVDRGELGSSLDTYLNQQSGDGGAILNEIDEEEVLQKKSISDFFRKFYDSLFFFFENNILSIDENDIYIYIPIPPPLGARRQEPTVIKVKRNYVYNPSLFLLGTDTYDPGGDNSYALYRKYGGENFLTLSDRSESEGVIKIRDYYTSEFSEIVNQTGAMLNRKIDNIGNVTNLITGLLSSINVKVKQGISIPKDVQEWINQAEKELTKKTLPQEVVTNPEKKRVLDAIRKNLDELKKAIGLLPSADPMDRIVLTLMHPVYSGPYLNEINSFRAWKNSQLPEIEKEIKRDEAQLRTSRERLIRLRKGDITLKDIPDQPYRHRRGWTERPENSGRVTIKPIVVSAIDDAYKMIQNYISMYKISNNNNKKLDVEFFQTDPEIRGDFARLVAVKISFSAIRFPKQYLPSNLQKFTVVDQFNIMKRLKNNYVIVLDTEKSSFSKPTFKARSIQNRIGSNYGRSLREVFEEKGPTV